MAKLVRQLADEQNEVVSPTFPPLIFSSVEEQENDANSLKLLNDNQDRLSYLATPPSSSQMQRTRTHTSPGSKFTLAAPIHQNNLAGDEMAALSVNDKNLPT